MHSLGRQTFQIMLNSLHKYEPRLHIYHVAGQTQNSIYCKSFPECQFIAVTAYQNEEVTALKIKHNPFAKAFLDSKDRPDLQTQRDIMAQYPQAHHQQYGWYMGGGGGMCTGGVTYGQAPPTMGLAPPPVSLSSRLAVNMRNHRVVPYTSPTPRSTRTPPANGMAQQQSGMGPYGLAGLAAAAEWRQQSWGHHHHHQVAPNTTTTPSHHQWSGLQGGHPHTSHSHAGHHGAGLYQGYQQCGSSGMGLPNTSIGTVPQNHSASHAQRSPQEALTPMATCSDPPASQGFVTARSSPRYESMHPHCISTSMYGGGRLHGESPETQSTGASSPQSGGSPSLIQHPSSTTSTSQTEMFILPDLTFPSGLISSHNIKAEDLAESLSAYTTPSPHAWSPISPPCM